MRDDIAIVCRPPHALFHTMILSPNQQTILDQLLPVAHLATHNPCGDFPLKPRMHSLICAPSGSGKSHLMKLLGMQIDAPVLLLNVSSWQPLGSRAQTNTWDVIVKFIENNDRGIIVLDELDKLASNADWVAYIQLEIHDLLDGVIPSAIDTDNNFLDSDSLW